MDVSTKNKKVELLSPAGSSEIGICAFKAGADAVYIGGDKYGARATAISTSQEESNKIKNLIEFAHSENKKVYITVNTLFKEKELDDLFSYTDKFYEMGADSFIIQDLGVAKLVYDRYIKNSESSKFQIHASTQICVSDIYSLHLMKELGFSKVILERELSLSKIKEICKEALKIGIDIETFIHGSMCYCISGQCLMSSYIGGRSGNRGRCAGPCRHPYFLPNDTKHETNILSMKDMCTLSDIGNLINAGVSSFKIEGRLRSKDYVEGVTKTYRKYIDLFLKDEKLYYDELKAHKADDENFLYNLHKKGGFSNYLYNHNSKKMVNI